ncbi:MAG: ABC transporter ATP-binding protein [Peptococcaceae bacterium]|nr:ABC transporter ATP-binding protein [Peptococcaceae bacterium]
MALLEMRHIDKLFFGRYANRDVSLQVQKGEIHALLGENGAGKTTLMNILYGIYRRDGGEIFWRGEAADFLSPKDAIEKNIGMVHQHFMLVPTLTVAENITLGLREKGYPFTDRAALSARVAAISEKYGLLVEPGALISSLSVGERQRVEIIKLLYRGAELLILDEPTAVLTPGETAGFFNVLKRLRADGCSVIIITHRIPEVMEIADRVTVLRDTRCVFSAPIAELDEIKLSEHMIGRELAPPTRGKATAAGGEGLVLAGIGLQENGIQRLRDVTFSARPGEILGIAGVDGNGQKALAETIMGIRRPTAGEISLGGRSLAGLSVAARKALGMAYISDDRHEDGLVLDMDLAENLLLKFNRDKRYASRGLIDQKRVLQKLREAVGEYDIRAPSLRVPIRYLSGGNQQKLILARELSDHPQVIVAFQPTRGLDIGASEFIRQQLLAHREMGARVLLISADLEEIRALSDRIAVIHKGCIMGIRDNSDDLDMTEIGLMMAGNPAGEVRAG